MYTYVLPTYTTIQRIFTSVSLHLQVGIINLSDTVVVHLSSRIIVATDRTESDCPTSLRATSRLSVGRAGASAP